MADSRLEALLQRSIGLHLETVGAGFLGPAVKAQMLRTGAASPDEYLQLVESDSAELQELIEAIVVPETWFFRDPEAFAALGTWAATEWAPAHPGEVMRVLSVPCSTGEEPYSIAISLLNAGLAPSEFRVDAMDISARNIALAEASTYRPYSFRGMTPEISARFFRMTPAGMRIDDTIRERVSFQQGNVLESLRSLPTAGFDVVFCRNLLIYFDRPTQLQTLDQIERLLAKDGVLFVGSAEAFMVRAFGCQALSHPMSFGFRLCKQAPVPPQHNRPLITANATKPRPFASTPKPPPHPAPKHAAAPAPLPSALSSNVVDDLAQARQLADRGEFAEARAICEAALTRTGECADCYFLLGLIDDAENRIEKAAAHYRKALYLQPRHSEALAHMALVSEKLGDTGNAERFRRRARRNMSDAAGGTK